VAADRRPRACHRRPNASRTLLFNIHTGQWDEELLKILRVPRSMLLNQGFSANFGDSVTELLAAASRSRASPATSRPPHRAGVFFAGHDEVDLRHGLFALLNTGATPVVSKNKLLTTIAYQLKGQRTYALEGSIFVAGSSVQWLRDG